MAETTPALPPAIAALLDAYRDAVRRTGWPKGGQPGETENMLAEVAARAALEAEIATLAQDAALGKALRRVVHNTELGREVSILVAATNGVPVFGVRGGELTDCADLSARLTADAARTPTGGTPT